MIMEPKNWNVYLFRDILERVEVPVNVESNKEYVQIGIRSHGKGLFYKEPVLGKALGNKQVFWIQPNCFILNVVFAWEQAITKTTENEIGKIGSHRFPMYRPKNDLVDIDYLIYYFLTKRGTDILEAASPGGAGRNRTLGQERFLKSKITLPPLSEQQKIAAILSTQDKVIELKEKLLAQKRQQKKYLMQQLLMPKNKEKSFKSIHLSDISRLIKKHVDGQKFNYVSTENISPNLSGKALFDESNIEISGVGFNAGDILVGNIRPYLKKVWRANKDGLCSTDVLVFRPIGISSEFLYYLIANDNFFFYVMTTAKGSKMPRGDKKAIMNAKMLIPESKIEQNFLVELLSTADHEIDLLQKSIEAEKQKKKALMQLLLTGKVRVKI